MKNIRSRKLCRTMALTGIVVCAAFLGCVDFSDSKQDETAADGEFRIPLGTCADVPGPTVNFGDVYSILSLPAGAGSKGCAGCHSLTPNSGGWNLGTTQTQAYNNITTLSGLSGKRLITPNNINDSNIIVRMSLIFGAEPRNGTLWNNTELQTIKRWVCQGAPGPIP